jgi:hydrogenase-1 operon protein HyaF
MSSIEHISIRIASFEEMLTGQAEAVLTEVAEMLKRLLEEGVEDSIDLRSLPLTPADRDWLDERLGRGEVEIVLEAGGRSVLAETAFPGVWKIMHRDTEDRIVAELIEVAFVPAIIRPDQTDIEKGYEGLLLKLKVLGA